MLNNRSFHGIAPPWANHWSMTVPIPNSSVFRNARVHRPSPRTIVHLSGPWQAMIGCCVCIDRGQCGLLILSVASLSLTDGLLRPLASTQRRSHPSWPTPKMPVSSRAGWRHRRPVTLSAHAARTGLGHPLRPFTPAA